MTRKINKANRRTVQVHCLFKPAEKKLLDEAAEKAGVKVNHFIRSLIIPVAEKIMGQKVNPL
jgi:uncharacterized protein (DUF1778 family)